MATGRYFLHLVLIVMGLYSCDKPVDTSGTSADFSKGSWIDLSYPFDKNTIYWPTDTQGFYIDTVFYGTTDQEYFYSAFTFCSAEHGGTHLDAPVHFAKGKKSVEQISLDQLIGPVVVIDVSEKAQNDPDYLVTVADFTLWESTYGKLPEDVMVLIRTGHGKFWPDRGKYLGTTLSGPEAVALLHFPGLSPEAASWLTTERNIKAIGLDTPSIDYGQSSGFETHRILFDENIPAFENLANLERLPVKGSWMIALPMAIAGGSGAPLRAVAWTP
jgi:kynurenine formamidase